MTATRRTVMASTQGRIGLLLAVTALVATACGQPDQGAGETVLGCRPLERETVASLQRALPPAHRIDEAIAHDYADRVREHDGAPFTVVAARVTDENGATRYDQPLLWIIGGGTGRAHETLPKNYHLLNDAAVQAHTDALNALDEQTRARRIMLPDARDLRTPFSETDSAVVAALACLQSAPAEVSRSN